MAYYTQHKRKVGKYGTDSYSSSSSSSHMLYRSSTERALPLIEKRAPGCCGRGCKPCITDLGL